MKKIMILTLLLVFLFTLSACCTVPESAERPLVRVVTRISISLDNVTRTYSSTESLSAILAYLRLLSPTTNADQAPTQGSMYRISLIYSDGSRQDFRQQDTFFQDSDGKWKNIREQDMLNFSKLFSLLEPESMPSAT